MAHQSGKLHRSSGKRQLPASSALWRTAGLLLMLLPLAVQPVRAALGRYQVVEIKPHVFAWVPEDILDYDGDSRFALAGTAGFVITNDGVVVINTTNSPNHSSELLYEIRQRTDLPVTTVINTDARGDHMLGNEVFVDQRADIISSAAAQAAMERYHLELLQRLSESGEDVFRLSDRMRGIHFSLPNRTFDQSLTLHVGGVEFRLERLGQGPSPGDFVVYLPASRVLFMGDLYENGVIPSLAPSELPAWMDILRRAEQLPADVYVPGHGAPGSKQDLEEFQSFLAWAASQLAKPSLARQPLVQFDDGKPLLRSLAAPASTSASPAP
jgi:glyoxylase-like metal-dependent hydrolase (beta-lactamase superfamily II)